MLKSKTYPVQILIRQFKIITVLATGLTFDEGNKEAHSQELWPLSLTAPQAFQSAALSLIPEAGP